MFLEAVNKIFLAVVAGGEGNFSHCLPRGGEQIFRLVNAAQHNIFIGRVTCLLYTSQRLLRRAGTDRFYVWTGGGAPPCCAGIADHHSGGLQGRLIHLHQAAAADHDNAQLKSV